MSDLIRREDAIEAMKQRYDDILRTFKRKVKVGEKAIVMDMIGCVKALPSADRPSGEWQEKETFNNEDSIIERWQSARCSMCERYHTTPYMYYFNDYNFCPNCGADMRKRKEK